MRLSVEWRPALSSLPLTFDVEGPLFLRDFRGIGPIRPYLHEQAGIDQPGATVTAVEVPSRNIELEVVTRAESREQYWERRADMAESLAAYPVARSVDFPAGKLRFNRVGQEPLEIDAIPVDAPDPMRPGPFILWWMLMFRCPTPYFRCIGDHYQSMQTDAGGRQFPIEFPLEFESYSAEMTVTVGGDVPTPLRATIHGPLTNPSLRNLRTAAVFRIETELAAGERIELNTGWGEKAVTVYRADETVENGLEYVDLDVSTFWSLMPKANTVQFAADQNAGGYAELRWRCLHAGI